MITTERLILRPFTKSDAADLLEYLYEPTVHCFYDMKISSMVEAQEEAVKRMKTDCYFAIELKDTGKVIGEVFVYPDEEGVKEESSADAYFNDTYSPCWMLNKDYHGKGYAYEAVKAVFDHLFNVKGARRLYAYTEDYNTPSQKLCEKLGMRCEGLFMEFISFVNDEKGNPIYENTYQYAILKKEWK
jgi:RimJ/RimL family protein N-acetyltransferase